MESYSEIEQRMFQKYKELTGCSCADASDISIKIKLLAGELFNLQSTINWLNNQLFPQTASGAQLDYHAQMRGLERKKKTYATGRLHFYVSEPAQSAIVIPSGIFCSTAGKNPVLFMTVGTTSIGPGLTTAEADAVALTAGIIGNAAPNAITVISQSSNSHLEVTNPIAFSGGTDDEDDDSLRRRIIEDIKTPSTGTNKAYYKRLAESVDGVYSANVVSRQRGGGTVDIYIAAQGEAAGSGYVTQVQELIDSERELNVDVLVASATTARVAVSLTLKEKSGYSFEEVKTNVTEKIKEYFSMLQVGESVYVSSLGAAINKAEGVERFLFSSTSAHNVSASPSQLLTAGSITIEQG